METLDLKQAAKLLCIHPDTLRARAAAGIVRGYKPGRSWVFFESEVIEYLRSTCPSTSEKTANTGGAKSQLPVKQLDDQLARLLSD